MYPSKSKQHICLWRIWNQKLQQSLIE